MATLAAPALHSSAAISFFTLFLLLVLGVSEIASSLYLFYCLRRSLGGKTRIFGRAKTFITASSSKKYSCNRQGVNEER